MTVTDEKKTGVVSKLFWAAKLCRDHGYFDWDVKIRQELCPRVKNYQGCDCADLIALVEQGEKITGVETFETMLCNQVSTYIDVMKLHKLPDDLPPFTYMNGIVLEHAAALGPLMSQILLAHGSESDSNTQFVDAGLPLEYLHTLIRAYFNKGLLLGFLQKLRSEEFKYLSDKCDQLYDQYVAYPNNEKHRVCLHYGRTCHGELYDGKRYLVEEAKEK